MKFAIRSHIEVDTDPDGEQEESPIESLFTAENIKMFLPALLTFFMSRPPRTPKPQPPAEETPAENYYGAGKDAAQVLRDLARQGRKAVDQEEKE